MFLNASLFSNIFSFPLRNQVPVRRKVGQNIDLHSILDQAGIGCPISSMGTYAMVNQTVGDFPATYAQICLQTKKLSQGVV